MIITFDTTPYAREHLKEPRGRGMWAFECFDAFDGLLWATGTYADAKAEVKRRITAAAPEGFDG